MTLYNGKYRIESARKKNWDYSTPGYYYITICTAHMKIFFGDVIDGVMYLNEAGKIVDEALEEIPRKYPNILLDIKQVMPNHLHAIFIVTNKKNALKITSLNIEDDPELNFFSTLPGKFPDNKKDKKGGCTGVNNPMLKDNLSTALRAQKEKCTTLIRKFNPEFDWHERFHDHIIRNAESYQEKKQYIIDNPKNWRNDKYFRE